MKKDKVVSFLWSFLLSFCLSCSAVMWLVTAFSLGVDTGLLTAFCLIAALLCSLCYSLPLGGVPLGIGALTLGYLWRSGALEAGVEALLNRLSRQYNKAYNWGIIRWGLRTADEMEPTIVTALCILAAITVLATAWAVCRRKSAVYPVMSVLYVAACFVVTDTVPSAGWIFLLLMTVAVLMMTGTVRRQNEAAGNRLCLMLTPAVALGLLVVFLLNPRSTYDRQEAAKEMMEKVLGSDHVQYLMGELEGNNTNDQRVDLTVVGYRTAPEGKVMEVTAPFTGVLYLRSRAMDTYDGKSWTYSGGPDLPWPEEFLENVGEVTISTRFAHQMLYVPYYSRFSSFTDIGPGEPNEKNLREYSFTCQQLPANMTPQAASMLSSQFYSVQLDDYLHITPEVKAWAEPYALEITQGARSVSEKAERIASFVRNSARYDLETPRMPTHSEDFAKWFLENSETGYCVHFATSTAVLLQAVGIPARYVTGYLTSVKAGEVTEVKSKESHAWVEYWLPGFGWTVLESTPPQALPESQETVQTEPTTPEQQESVTAPTADATQPGAQTPPTEETTTPNAQLLPGKDQGAVLTAVVCVAGAVLLLAMILGQRGLRLRQREKRLAAAAPNERALLFWQETGQLARLLKDQPPKELLELAEKAKFSHHTLTPEELQQFGAFRKDAVEKMKKRNIFLQIYYRLILAKY